MRDSGSVPDIFLVRFVDYKANIFEGERSVDAEKEVFGRVVTFCGHVFTGYFRGMNWKLNGKGVAYYNNGSFRRGLWDGQGYCWMMDASVDFFA